MNISGNLSAQTRVAMNLQNTTPNLKKLEQEEQQKTEQQSTQNSTVASNYGNASTEQYLANMGINIVSANKIQVGIENSKVVADPEARLVELVKELEEEIGSIEDLPDNIDDILDNQCSQTKGIVSFFRRIRDAVVNFLRRPDVQEVIGYIDAALYVTDCIPVVGPFSKIIHKVVGWANGLA